MEGLACIAGLWEVPVDPARDLQWKMPPASLRRLPLPFSLFDHQRKGSEGTARDLVWSVVGDPITALGPGRYCGCEEEISACLMHVAGEL